MVKKSEVLHLDCLKLSKKTLAVKPNQRFYLLGALDDDGKTCWIEFMEDKTSLTVMFSILKTLKNLKDKYGLTPSVVETDNAGEFCSGEYANNKCTHPVERFFVEMKIKHKYTNTYRPEQNGGIEEFWQTVKDEFIKDNNFKTTKEFKDKLNIYIEKYNKEHKKSSK